jgi:hypothetical protein
VAQPQERKFLGFSFTADPDFKRTIAPKSLGRFKQRIRDITRRAKGVSIKTTMEAAHIVCKPLGVERIVRQKVEPFLLHLATTAALDPPHLHFQKYPRVVLHLATTAALDPPHLHFQKYPRVAAGKIAHAADVAVVL